MATKGSGVGDWHAGERERRGKRRRVEPRHGDMFFVGGFEWWGMG